MNGQPPIQRRDRYLLRRAATICVISLGLAACGSGSDAATRDGVASLETPAGAGADTAAPATDPGDPTSDTAAADIDPDLAFAEFEDCMADHGVDVSFGSPGDVGRLDVESDDSVDDLQTGTRSFSEIDADEFQAAEEACRHFLDALDNGFEMNPEQEAAFADAQLAFTKCMTEQGFDIGDMSDGGGFTVITPSDGNTSGGFDLNDQSFEDINAAMTECEHVFADLDELFDDGGDGQ